MADPAPKADSYRELLLNQANGEPVNPQLLTRWRIEEEFLRAAYYDPKAYRHSGLQAAHFGAPVHGVCWQALVELHDQNPDSELGDVDLLSQMRTIAEERLGGPRGWLWLSAFLSESSVTRETGLNVHLRKILSYHRAHRQARQYATLAERLDTDPDISGIEADFIAAASDNVYQYQGEGVLESPIDQLQWDARTSDLGSLVKTGNKFLDVVTGGGHGRGELLVWGGGTNCGKSYAAQRMIRAQAQLGLKVLYISCEDPLELMRCRMFADFCDPPFEPKEIRNRKADAAVVEAAIAKQRACFGGRVYIVERKKPTIGQLCSLIRAYHYTVGLDSVIIDYLQAITEDEPMQNKVQEMASITSKLKRCFTECYVAGTAFSQYNRESYKNGAEPDMNSFKYCGDIENEAEILVLYWRDADNVLHARVPKLKWSKGGRYRFIVHQHEVTGCELSWEEDNQEEGTG
ncbi:MAG: hypothetical protein JRD89_02440 [Deltaproteobacteria bacterium]|nr:hypothetical protein [Deltaproteobacteria bacterium]